MTNRVWQKKPKAADARSGELKRQRWEASLKALVLCVSFVCVMASAPSGPPVPVSGQWIDVQAVSLPLNPQDLKQRAVGDFHYAGGLALTSDQTEWLHGFSDLEITGSDKLTAVADIGNFLEARLVFDQAKNLVGLKDAKLTPMMGEDGKPLTLKQENDGEGLALLKNGDRLVSFEEHHRILLYPAKGGLPHALPIPDTVFQYNMAMEALATDPAHPDTYLVGSEENGHTWVCQMATKCTEGPTVVMGPGFNLVSMKRLANQVTLYLLRAYDPLTGINRNSLQIFRQSDKLAQLDIQPPLLVDNFEGVAAVPIDGGLRFYLMSDDNNNPTQRTLLVAFDWKPRAGMSQALKSTI